MLFLSGSVREQRCGGERMVKGVKLLAVDTQHNMKLEFSLKTQNSSEVKFSLVESGATTIARCHRWMWRVSEKTFLKCIMSSSMNTFFFGFPTIKAENRPARHRVASIRSGSNFGKVENSLHVDYIIQAESDKVLCIIISLVFGSHKLRG